MSFKIAPFDWQPNQDDTFFQAVTPFGNYTVNADSDGCQWAYCFDEYYDEAGFSCESVEDGKQRAPINSGALLERQRTCSSSFSAKCKCTRRKWTDSTVTLSEAVVGR